MCSPPRKSLVKGERFIRFEGKPECRWNVIAEDPTDINLVQVSENEFVNRFDTHCVRLRLKRFAYDS